MPSNLLDKIGQAPTSPLPQYIRFSLSLREIIQHSDCSFVDWQSVETRTIVYRLKLYGAEEYPREK